VLFGFLALIMVTSWIITAGWNPLVTTRFVYPFSFVSPFKILANLGGVALLFGTAQMIWERLKPKPKSSKGTYFDWLFLLTLFFIVLTGFAAEGLHYLRLVPHRHVMYFTHLVLVTVLIWNFPFTKFAHVVYRTAAVVVASQFDREGKSTDLLAASVKGERDDRP
jgi:quinone-modifying oxidoreductase subunit QmoC